MDNRRKETRKKLMAFTLVHDERGKLLGYLGNITENGAMVIGEKTAEVNSVLKLDIRFADELQGGLKKLVVSARVARCVPNEESSREFNIGFEFRDVTPEQTKIIDALLERYYFRHRDWEKQG